MTHQGGGENTKSASGPKTMGGEGNEPKKTQNTWSPAQKPGPGGNNDQNGERPPKRNQMGTHRPNDPTQRKGKTPRASAETEQGTEVDHFALKWQRGGGGVRVRGGGGGGGGGGGYGHETTETKIKTRSIKGGRLVGPGRCQRKLSNGSPHAFNSEGDRSTGTICAEEEGRR